MYQPILDWPESLTDLERWEYFRAHCSRDNLTAADVTDCAYDSGGDIAVLIYIYDIMIKICLNNAAMSPPES